MEILTGTTKITNGNVTGTMSDRRKEHLTLSSREMRLIRRRILGFVRKVILMKKTMIMIRDAGAELKETIADKCKWAVAVTTLVKPVELMFFILLCTI